MNLFFHDTIYFHDTVYIDLNGIENVQTTEARIYQRDGQIVVEIEDGSGPLDVRVYDAVGRLLSTRQGEGIRFDVPAAGAYLVCIGDHPARRVVIVR